MATQSVVSVHRTSGMLRPVPALIVLVGYAAMTMEAATARIGRGDA